MTVSKFTLRLVTHLTISLHNHSLPIKVLLLSTIVKNEGSTVTWNNGYKIILNEKIIRVVYIVAM